jgi:hypothetical protein
MTHEKIILTICFLAFVFVVSSGSYAVARRDMAQAIGYPALLNRIDTLERRLVRLEVHLAEAAK